MTVPPRAFIAGLVQLPVMPAAKRYRELIAHLEPHGSRLREPQVMGIGGLPAADEARLRGNEFQVCLVAQSFGFGNRKLALVDPRRRQFYCGRTLRLSYYSAAVFGCCLVLSKQVGHGAMVAPAVVV